MSVLLRIYRASAESWGWEWLVMEPEVGREIAFGAPNPCVWPVGCSYAAARRVNEPTMVSGASRFLSWVMHILYCFSAQGTASEDSRCRMGGSDVMNPWLVRLIGLGFLICCCRDRDSGVGLGFFVSGFVPWVGGLGMSTVGFLGPTMH